MEKTHLSASKIDTLNKCSYMLWLKYFLRLPQAPSEAMNMGTCLHTIFEVLMNKRHRKHYINIVSKGNISDDPAIWRLVLKNAKKLRIDSQENLALLNDMTLVGLNYDFLCKGGKLIGIEQEIKLDGESYSLIGYLDAVFERKDIIEVNDYKSGGKKYTTAQLAFNVQALTYAFAVGKIYKKDALIRFLFLKHPKNPAQELKYSKQQLKGFESYLEYLGKYLNPDNFTIKEAESDFAADDPKRRYVCDYMCSFKSPFDYYVILDKDEKVVKSSLKKEDLPAIIEGQTIQTRHYDGCPRWNFTNKIDSFDF